MHALSQSVSDLRRVLQRQMAIERVAGAAPSPGAAADVTARQTRVLTLEHGDHLDSTLYRRVQHPARPSSGSIRSAPL